MKKWLPHVSGYMARLQFDVKWQVLEGICRVACRNSLTYK